MRVIKLSPRDPDMLDDRKVEEYFTKKLAQRNPRGQFLFTKHRISQNGISEGELLIFSYQGKLVYLGVADSGRMENKGSESVEYPYYFCIDTKSIVPAKGTLEQLEQVLRGKGVRYETIVQCQGWPIIKDSPQVREIWESFKT